MLWFRMYHEFATDPKVQMLSEVDQRRFVMVLCLKACNGDVALHNDEVAFQLRISESEWDDTKSRLLARNLIQPDNTPTNWDKRQYISDSSSERVKRHREKVKRDCNVTVTPPDTDTDTDTEIKSDKRETRKTKVTSHATRGQRLEQYLEQNPTALSDMLQWTEQNTDWEWRGSRGINDTFEQFRDYWRGAAGAKGVKSDWPATWRNWCRREADRKPAQQRAAYSQQPSKLAAISSQVLAGMLDRQGMAGGAVGTHAGASATNTTGNGRDLQAVEAGEPDWVRG